MEFLSYLISGISLGSVYAIIALGYTMVYGIAKMLNFAHGDVIMIGGYVSFCAMFYLGLPSIVAVLMAVVVCTVLGIVIERLAYKPLRSAPSLAVLITAIGVSYFLQNSALLIWKAAARSYPPVVTGAVKIFGGKLTVSKTGKVTGAPKSIKLAKTGSAAITGTNSCKKLAALLSTAADSTKDALAQDKKEVETFLKNVANSVVKDGSAYSAIKMAVPADYFKQTEDEFSAYTKTLDPSDEAYGMTFEQFIDALLSAQIKSITNSVQSIKISVADLSDCKSKLTADQKQMYANCGDIAKAYIAKIKSDVTFKPGADTSGYNTDDLGEITVVNAGGNWYIAG